MELLTIAEIAKHLELPESTVRYYRDRFSAYVPAVGEGRSRRYRPEALAVLRFIADALRAGTPAEGVEAALQARFPVTVEPQQQSATTQQQDRSNAAATQQQLGELIADALRSTEKALLEVAEETATLRSETQQLRNELHAQQQQTAAAQQEAARAAQEAAATREALERLQAAQERQAEALREWLEKRLPEPQAKRMGLVARVKAILWGDRKHGEL
jgi:DNA-binding transcriptional MerR regulator